ncbi:MAPK-activated protein kinase Srk1 [Dimargaris cristalligena]|nr:MAPK-activated protein kinase Srk1 [Dimargaris cristalligena]
MISHLKNLLRNHKPAGVHPSPPSSQYQSTDNKHPSSAHTAAQTPSLPSPVSDSSPSTPTQLTPHSDNMTQLSSGQVNHPAQPMGGVKSQPLSTAGQTKPSANDRFQLLERMGDGAFSVVYKAYDRHLQRHVAIKVARKFQMKSSQRASIYKEVSIMRTLRHSNVVSLLDFRESNDYFYLIMDLVPGGELFNRIVELTYFSEPLARHVILQVAEAIRYLHNERGVVHRDIKPENILFDPIPYIPDPTFVSSASNRGKKDEGVFIEGLGGGGIGRVRLADFGLSKVVWNEPTLTPCGTVGYTAPEIVNDQKYSTGVDMWALGCVLYTLLCGFPPFYDEDVQILTQKVACGYYTFLSPWWDDISDSAKDLISHLLTVNPHDRYSIDEFLAHPWCRIRLSSDMEGVETCVAPQTTVSEYHHAVKDSIPKSIPMHTPQSSLSPVVDTHPTPIPEKIAPAPQAPCSPPAEVNEVDTGRTGAHYDHLRMSVQPGTTAQPITATNTTTASMDKAKIINGRFIRESPARRAKNKRVQDLKIDLQSLGLDHRNVSPGIGVLFTPGGRQRVVAKTPITPVLTLKEAFDVSYAVRRVEHDEVSRRQTPFTPVGRSTPMAATPGPIGRANPGLKAPAAAPNHTTNGSYPFQASAPVNTPPSTTASVTTARQTATTIAATSQGLQVVAQMPVSKASNPAPGPRANRGAANLAAPEVDAVLASYANPLFSPIAETEEMDDDRRLIQTLFQRNADRLVSHAGVRGPVSGSTKGSARSTKQSSASTNAEPILMDKSYGSSGSCSTDHTAVESQLSTPLLESGSNRMYDGQSYPVAHASKNVTLDLFRSPDNTIDLDLDGLPVHQAGLHMSPQSSYHSNSSEPPVFDLDMSHSTLLSKRRNMNRKPMDKISVVS